MLALLAALGAVVLLVWFLAGGPVRPLPWPWPAPGGGDAPAREQVAAGVHLWGRDLSGWTAADLTAWLEEQAPSLAREPVPAELDPVSRGVIPERAGVRLDVPATVAAALQAPPDTRVEPRFEWLEPAATLDDFPLAPIYRGNPHRAQVTLMINVAWGNEELAQMLDILDAEGVRATFFLVGRWAERFPDLVRGLRQRGLEPVSLGTLLDPYDPPDPTSLLPGPAGPKAPGPTDPKALAPAGPKAPGPVVPGTLAALWRGTGPGRTPAAARQTQSPEGWP